MESDSPSITCHTSDHRFLSYLWPSAEVFVLTAPSILLILRTTVETVLIPFTTGLYVSLSYTVSVSSLISGNFSGMGTHRHLRSHVERLKTMKCDPQNTTYANTSSLSLSLTHTQWGPSKKKKHERIVLYLEPSFSIPERHKVQIRDTFSLSLILL